MGELRVRLFGAFEVTDASTDGGVSIGCRRAPEVLAYLLLVPGQSRSRDAVADAVWPEAAPDTSKRQIRQALWHLHGAVDDERQPESRLVLAEGEHLAINPQRPVWCDALSFLRSVDASLAPNPDDSRLETALDLYRGPLLDGWYSEWCLAERDRLEGVYLTALDAASVRAEARGDLPTAISWALAILRVDPAHERTHLRLMRLYHALNDRTRALRQFDRCVDALRDELGVGPSARTVEFASAVREDLVVVDGPPSDAGAHMTVSEIVRELLALRHSVEQLQTCLLDRLA